MTWVKLDDHFPEHPKVLKAGPMAGWLYISGLTYASRQLTDGFLPSDALPRLLPQSSVKTLAKRLVEAGLWLVVDGGWQIHDYHDYQPTAENIRARRENNARRQALFNNDDLRAIIRTRDADRCRYCGARVAWTDRRGQLGGTYDHVDPAGPNTLDNLVVACRACNSSKGSRTPEAASMPLLPPPHPFPDPPPNGRYTADNGRSTAEKQEKTASPRSRSRSRYPEETPEPTGDTSLSPGGAGGGDAAAPQKAGRKARGSRAPEAFEITERHYELAASYGVTRDRVQDQTTRFLDFHRARGTLFADWQAGWRTWMQRVVEYSRQPTPIRPGVAPARAMSDEDLVGDVQVERV